MNGQIRAKPMRLANHCKVCNLMLLDATESNVEKMVPSVKKYEHLHYGLPLECLDAVCRDTMLCFVALGDPPWLERYASWT